MNKYIELGTRIYIADESQGAYVYYGTTADMDKARVQEIFKLVKIETKALLLASELRNLNCEIEEMRSKI